MLCRNDSVMWNIPHIQSEYEEYSTFYCRTGGIFLPFRHNMGIFSRILSVRHNTVMALNNVMKCSFIALMFFKAHFRLGVEAKGLGKSRNLIG